MPDLPLQTMRSTPSLGLLSLFVLACFTPGELAAQAPPKAAPSSAVAKPKLTPDQAYVSQVVPFLKQYCLECHTAKKPDAEIQFEKYKDAAAVEADAKTWQKVLEMLNSSAMPPDDRPHPKEEQRKQVIDWIERQSPVQLVAIGIGHDVTRYYRRAVTIMDVEQLGGTMIEQLAALFEDE